MSAVKYRPYRLRFYGQAHADAYRRAAMFYPDLPKRPHLYALADQDQAMAERHAAKLGRKRPTATGASW